MQDNVMLIPARKLQGNRVTKQKDKPKLRVAAYCRVSTDSDEQAGSYETQVAQAAAEQVGMSKLSASEMTPQSFATIALLMSVCIMWGMVLSIFFNKKYTKKLGSDGGSGKAGFGDKAMTAMFIGLVSAYIGSYIGSFVSNDGLFSFSGDYLPLIVAAASAIVMALFVFLGENKKLAWVDNFSIAGSMIAGMAVAVLVKAL